MCPSSNPMNAPRLHLPTMLLYLPRRLPFRLRRLLRPRLPCRLPRLPRLLHRLPRQPSRLPRLPHRLLRLSFRLPRLPCCPTRPMYLCLRHCPVARRVSWCRRNASLTRLVSPAFPVSSVQLRRSGLLLVGPPTGGRRLRPSLRLLPLVPLRLLTPPLLMALRLPPHSPRSPLKACCLSTSPTPATRVRELRQMHRPSRPSGMLPFRRS